MWTGHFRSMTKQNIGNEPSLITNAVMIWAQASHLNKIKILIKLAACTVFNNKHLWESDILRCGAHEHTFSRFRWPFIASFPPLILQVSCFACVLSRVFSVTLCSIDVPNLYLWCSPKMVNEMHEIRRLVGSRYSAYINGHERNESIECSFHVAWTTYCVRYL